MPSTRLDIITVIVKYNISSYLHESSPVMEGRAAYGVLYVTVQLRETLRRRGGGREWGGRGGKGEVIRGNKIVRDTKTTGLTESNDQDSRGLKETREPVYML